VKAGSSFSNLGRDRLGSITGLTSTAQALSGTLTYDPWGRPEATSGNAADSNLRFAGSRRDPGTGYHQMGVRTYQYAWARFTTLDPLPASITHLNRYAYAGCNPANLVDPTGTQSCLLVLGELAVLGTVAALGFTTAPAVAVAVLGGAIAGSASLASSIASSDIQGSIVDTLLLLGLPFAAGGPVGVVAGLGFLGALSLGNNLVACGFELFGP
jgi:RHS repeat-associated protein